MNAAKVFHFVDYSGMSEALLPYYHCSLSRRGLLVKKTNDGEVVYLNRISNEHSMQPEATNKQKIDIICPRRDIICQKTGVIWQQKDNHLTEEGHH